MSYESPFFDGHSSMKESKVQSKTSPFLLQNLQGTFGKSNIKKAPEKPNNEYKTSLKVIYQMK